MFGRIFSRCPRLWLLLVVLLTGPAGAGAPLRFQRLTTTNGLANDMLLSLTQDAQGFIWAGTREGLSRYDGVEFRSFYHEADNPASLPGSAITALAPAPGGLWVATGAGLARYDARAQAFRAVPLGQERLPLGLRYAPQVFRSRRGEVWATAPTGLWRLGPDGRPRGHYVSGRVRGDLPGNSIKLDHHIEDAQGRLWLPVGPQLCVYDPATATFWGPRHNPQRWRALADPDTTNFIVALTVDGRGRVWYSRWDQGLYCFDPATNQLRKYPLGARSLPSNANCLLADRHGQLWVGTHDLGLACLNPATGAWRYCPADPGDGHALPHNNVFALLEDRQGNLWVGTSAGLAVHSPQTSRFEHWPLYEWAPPAAEAHHAGGHGHYAVEPSALLVDQQGRPWVGSSQAGLFRFDPATGRPRQFVPPDPHPLTPSPEGNARVSVQALAQDRAGRLWLGTDGGLVGFDPATEKWLTLPPPPPALAGMVDMLTPSVFSDRRDRLWINAFDLGLVCFDPATNTYRRITTSPGLNPADTIIRGPIQVAEAPDGTIWINCYGLHRLAPGARRATRIPEVPLRERGQPPFQGGIGVDAAGRVWFSQEADGLGCYDPRTGRHRNVSRRDGFVGEFVNSLRIDSRQNIWVGTMSGLNLRARGADRWRTFTQADGLPENDVEFCAADPRTGDLWLTTFSELVRVRPADLLPNRLPPPVALTGFAVNGRARRLPGADSVVTLQPHETTLTFDFAALNLLAPERNQYAWQLVRAGKRAARWIAAGTRRSVSLADLPPGEYAFRVKAANNDGVWNERGQTVRFRLLPPWYRTGWFYTLLAAGAAVILYGFYRQRVERLLALQAARDRIARDLHDDVGSTLSSILIQSRMPVPVGGSGAEDRLRRVGDSAQRMLESLHDIVWSVNPDHDPLPTVVARMRAFAAQTLEARGIALDFKIDGPIDRVELHLGRRRDFFLFFKEAINNLAKHSGAEIATVRLWAGRGQLHLVIADDGDGFDPETIKRGNGLRSLRKRADALGAQYAFTTVPRRGTRHELTFRV